MSTQTFVVFGGRGWIGSMLCQLLTTQGHQVIIPRIRLEDFKGVVDFLRTTRPDFVLHAAGLTGTPNVDWCESHKAETYQANTVGTFNLAMACSILHLHLTYFASGCIYHYDDTHPVGTSFKETDPPNFRGSTYSASKVMAEELLAPFNNVLTLRLRLPISSDTTGKNLITKLSKYSKVTDIPNSVTVLPQMLPIALDLIQKQVVGIFNFTNPGPVTHNEILTLYQEIIDPSHKWEIFSLEDQSQILKAPRSNCILDTSKLEEKYPLTPALAAIREVMHTMAE